MVPDRFVVYGDRYRDIREAVAQAVLSSNTNQVVVVLEVCLFLLRSLILSFEFLRP